MSGATATDPAVLDAATHDLVEATRRLMRRAASSAAGEAELRAATEAVDRVATALGEPGERLRRAPLDAAAAERIRAGEVWTMFPLNPMSVPLRITVEGRTARAELVPGALLEGPPGFLHGGFGAHLVDSLLGTLVQVAERPAFTAQLDINYRRPTLLDRPTVVEGVVEEVSGRKIRARGWISQDGVRTLEARGLFAVPAPAEGEQG